MFKSKLSKVIVSLLRRIAGVTRSGAKRLMRAMLQALMAMGRRARLPVAGFVLPTVTMVLLVVILLTVAIVFRSFDRANIARNVRVNQQVLAAATPALDRAKAKIQYILGPGKPTSDTPSDETLYQTMSSYIANDPTSDLYTFGDEKRLILRADLSATANGITDDNPQGSIFNPDGSERERINTAWRYPVDTNNDGKFDTFTLYGIYFRTPKIIGTTPRSRKSLDARTPPMRTGKSDPACTQGEGTVASLVGNSGWERIDGRFQKSFFVYTVNVPITQIEANTLGTANYQAFAGTPSISALEYQQDQSLIPLTNNAVVYEDDLDISPGPPLNINGRIVTNSNLLVSALGGDRQIKLFQVSSKDSCFYDRENSKIVVAGNVVNGNSENPSTANKAVEVHLFKATGGPEPNVGAPVINNINKSVNETSLQVLYNNQAYSQRLNSVVGGQMEADTGTNDPFSVQQAQKAPKLQTRTQALEDYFKARLRKVPFAEVIPGTANGGIDTAIPKTSYIQGSGDTLRPIDAWSFPNGTGKTGTLKGPTNIEIIPTQLESRIKVPPAQSELYLGERVIVGNNLPEKRWDGTKSDSSEKQDVDGATKWKDSEENRSRTPQVTKIGDVGATDRGNGTGEVPDIATAPNPPYRDGFWERTAAEISKTPLDSVGGLRVITSAGVYDRTNSFLPPPKWIDTTAGAGAGTFKTGPLSALVVGNALTTYDDPATPVVEQYPVVWPDSMPMSPLGPGSQVYDNTLGGVNEAANWRTWVSPLGTSGQLPVTAPDYSDLPQTQTNPNFPFVTENIATARKFAKGDLRMRATAVYHYANGADGGYDPVVLAAAPAGTQPQQKPLACVSSYYDPSNASTARNILTGALPDVSGEGSLARTLLVDNTIPTAGRGTRQAIIGSNNGITYGPPTRPNPAKSNPASTGLLSGGDTILEAQANLVFPDGRFANGPLRTALQVEPTARTLAQQAAIDSTNCALQILDGSIARAALIPDGAIQEVAFLNGREIKAVDRDEPTTIVNEAFTLSSPLTGLQAAQLKGYYNQPLEEREPLEIRATQLNLNLLRGGATPFKAGEFLLPNSGIIYASRDDALPDRSNRFDPTDPLGASASKRASPSDYQLDPTRKPNGIVLIRGQQLFRGGATPTATKDLNVLVQEKGLTLVSNLPVYIKGLFNPHGNIRPLAAGAPANFAEVEEFTETVNSTWSNFYANRTKTELDPNFACRAEDPRLSQCTIGDFWRPANVLADSVTLLSQNYRFGFRNEGDFDLRNNAGAAAVFPRRQQGFFNNNFVTNGLSSGAFLSLNGNLAQASDPPNTRLTDNTYRAAFAPGLFTSSYFNNFVTPVQRRGPFPEYVMETCTKLPVSECTDADWFVDPLASPTPLTALAAGPVYTSPVIDPATRFKAGSTVDPPVPQLQRFARRVAFERNATNQLPDAGNPKPLGVTATLAITPDARVVALRPGGNNALWFAANNAGNVAYDADNLPYRLNKNNTPPGTTDSSRVPLPTVAPSSTPLPLPPLPLPPATYAYSGSQPLLIPVPQLMNEATVVLGTAEGLGAAQDTGWIPQAEAQGTTFNLIIAAGDTPSRALDTTTGDFNGGLQNLPRFLEVWSIAQPPPAPPKLSIPTNIRGSFIQQNRSAFSTAPYLPILPTGFPAAPADQLASLFALSPTPPPGIRPVPLLQPIRYSIQGGRIPYFTPPTRNWGFDVGLLSQPPDLFTQKFTTPSTETRPPEYFREVSRDDEWVTTLMCGTLDTGGNATSSRRNCPT